MGETQLTRVFEMMMERLSNLETSVGMLITSAKDASEDRAAGTVLSGVLIRKGGPPLRICKQYNGRLNDNDQVVVTETDFSDAPFWAETPDWCTGVEGTRTWMDECAEQVLGREVVASIKHRCLEWHLAKWGDGDDDVATCKDVGWDGGATKLAAKRREPRIVAMGTYGVALRDMASLDEIVQAVDRITAMFGAAPTEKMRIVRLSRNSAMLDLELALLRDCFYETWSAMPQHKRNRTHAMLMRARDTECDPQHFLTFDMLP